MKNLKVYLVEYASGMFRCNNRQNTDVCSNKELKEGEFIVVEHKDCGIFIGKVISDESEDFLESEINDIEYNYVKHIDLKDYFENINKQKRKEELKQQMQDRFKIIDEEKKYQYYAELDSELKAMYDEYKNL